MNPLTGLAEALNVAQRVKPRLDKLRDATNGFEAIFLKTLLTSMRRGVPESATEKSFGGEMYRDMLDQALATQAGKSGTLGIGKLLYERLAPLAIAQEQARVRMGRLPREEATTAITPQDGRVTTDNIRRNP